MGKTLYLAQNPLSLFTEVTVEEELLEAYTFQKKCELTEKEKLEKVHEMLFFLELEPQTRQNPMDLSGGQQQRLAMGKLLLLEPDVLLLDEPTKGLDWAFKEKLGTLLQSLSKQGKTIVLVSHDMEFCCRFASHCGLLFDGAVISLEQCRAFFESNQFYTTTASRMAAGLLPHCISSEDIVDRLRQTGGQ